MQYETDRNIKNYKINILKVGNNINDNEEQ